VATRFYLRDAAPTYDPGVFVGNWLATTNGLGRAMSTLRPGEAYADLAITSGGSHLQAFYRLVSAPIAQSLAITSSMTVNWVLTGAPGATTGSPSFRYLIYATVGDSTSIRGYLDSASTNLISRTDASMVGSTTIQGRALNGGTAVAMVGNALAFPTLQVGDRIVVELGWGVGGATTDHIGRGGTSATDQSDGSTDTTRPGWIEFSFTANFPEALNVRTWILE
jgi:hypothetical protein